MHKPEFRFINLLLFVLQRIQQKMSLTIARVALRSGTRRFQNQRLIHSSNSFKVTPPPVQFTTPSLTQKTADEPKKDDDNDKYFLLGFASGIGCGLLLGTLLLNFGRCYCRLLLLKLSCFLELLFESLPPRRCTIETQRTFLTFNCLRVDTNAYT